MEFQTYAEESPEAILKAQDGSLSLKTNEETLDGFSHIMFATGRRPNTKDQIAYYLIVSFQVDEYSRTSVPSIWAVGDATDRLNLTPVAWKNYANLGFEVQDSIRLGVGTVLYAQRVESVCCDRDIKSSNVMLDEDFNAKLGDFRLARFADHERGLNTTKIAGTLDYMAPECVVTGKAGKESDVYSFGVVALEIACGRRTVEHKEEENKGGLVAWVWELYGSGKHLEAADNRLSMEYDKQQMERLIVVGLWCASLDHTQRPSLREVFNVLSSQTDPVPNLPSKMLVPTYASSSNASDQQRNPNPNSLDSGKSTLCSTHALFLNLVPR
ncbi:hypothetical protein IFM89_001107 [Coptis chinensis]|uniref:Protein kinase domain-containing protein n=1 Tax=Coptis chinensis TaxID=261450 RepID=A0A835M960_9MAGN|nr:hypothetical protein IFM89_001107 [Coptis chinensis]